MNDPQLNAAYADLGRLHMLRALAGLETSIEQGTRLMHSVYSGNYRFLYGSANEHEGYIIWAAIDRHSYLSLKRGGPMPRYRHEWNEGSLVLVLDVVLVARARGRFLTQLLALTRQWRDIVLVRHDRPVRRYRRFRARQC